MTLEEKMHDLIKQATTERSHYYAASVLVEALQEISRLKEYEWMYKDLEK